MNLRSLRAAAWWYADQPERYRLVNDDSSDVVEHGQGTDYA